MNKARSPQRIGKLAKAVYLCILVLSSVLIASYLVYPPVVGSINNKITDVIMSFQRPLATTGMVTIVDIDDKSLAQYGQWPWSRYRLAGLLKKIRATGCSSIGIDMILAEPDRTSPENWQSDIARELGYTVDISRIPQELQNHDAYLVDTLSQGPYVLGYEFLFTGMEKEASCRLHPVNTVEIDNGGVSRSSADLFFTARGVVGNQRQFSDAVSRSGFLNITPDRDGILRRVPLLIRFKDRLYPSFALASLMRQGNTSQVRIIQRENGLHSILAAGKIIPVDDHGNMVIDFPKGTVVAKVSAADVLENRIPAGSLGNRIVLVGSTASGLGKTYQAAKVQIHSDVELHARLIENLLSRQKVTRSGAFLPWEVLAALLAVLMVCVAVARLEMARSGVITLLLAAAFWGGPIMLFRETGWLFSPLLPTLLLSVWYVPLIILKSWNSQQDARQKVSDTLILLKSRENDLDSIIRSVPDIIFRLDSLGRITFISPAVSKYTNAAEKLIGRPIFDLVVPDDLDKARYRLNEKRTGERATHGLEIRLLLHHNEGDGDATGIFSVSAEGIYRGKSPQAAEFIGTQGIIRDITEQKKLEERLLHAEKMEVVGNLAAGVAHDLNNILSGLIAYPELLLLELPKDSPLRTKVLAIHKSGQKAAAIVEDLLTLARRGVKTAEIVNLNTVVSDYLASPEFEAARNIHPHIAIETDPATDLMTTMGSRVHLSKAIMNMVNNASEAMPAGGVIRISTCNRYLDAPLSCYEQIPAGEYVCLTIADEGVGIAAADLHKIFEPFYSKKMMRRSGSGLGMTIIWATVKDYNGYLDIHSVEGEGTSITVYLPAHREHEEVVSKRISIEEYLGTEHIHVVDDMPEQTEIAAKMLTKLGYTVTSSPNGEAALEFLRANEPDLVVLDMIMPGSIDGLETYRKLIEIRRQQKVIIASGFSESDRVRAAQELGAGAYVQKPYTLEKIGVAVRRELDRR